MKRYSKKEEPKRPYEPLDQSKPSIHPSDWDWELTLEEIEAERKKRGLPLRHSKEK